MTPPRIGPQHRGAVLVRLRARRRGNYVYGVVPGGPLPRAVAAARGLQQAAGAASSTCGTGCRTGWSRRSSYLYEPFDVYDFAFDPTVVNSIVQPSSLVLGYVYRPYTAHSVVFGVRVLLVEPCQVISSGGMEDLDAQDARDDVLVVRDRAWPVRSDVAEAQDAA